MLAQLLTHQRVLGGAVDRCYDLREEIDPSPVAAPQLRLTGGPRRVRPSWLAVNAPRSGRGNTVASAAQSSVSRSQSQVPAASTTNSCSLPGARPTTRSRAATDGDGAAAGETTATNQRDASSVAGSSPAPSGPEGGRAGAERATRSERRRHQGVPIRPNPTPTQRPTPRPRPRRRQTHRTSQTPPQPVAVWQPVGRFPVHRGPANRGYPDSLASLLVSRTRSRARRRSEQPSTETDTDVSRTVPVLARSRRPTYTPRPRRCRRRSSSSSLGSVGGPDHGVDVVGQGGRARAGARPSPRHRARRRTRPGSCRRLRRRDHRCARRSSRPAVLRGPARGPRADLRAVGGSVGGAHARRDRRRRLQRRGRVCPYARRRPKVRARRARSRQEAAPTPRSVRCPPAPRERGGARSEAGATAPATGIEEGEADGVRADPPPSYRRKRAPEAGERTATERRQPFRRGGTLVPTSPAPMRRATVMGSYEGLGYDDDLIGAVVHVYIPFRGADAPTGTTARCVRV